MCQGFIGVAGSVNTQGQNGYRWHKGTSGAIRGCLGAGMGLLGGVRGHWAGEWTGSPTTLGPIPGSQHSHWFPLGSDLPHQARQGPLSRVPSLPLVSLGE